MKQVNIGYQDTPEKDFPHNNSDDDIGNGIDNFHLGQGSEVQAMRDQLSRNLEELLADAAEWSRMSKSEAAKTVHELLEQAFTLVGQALERSADEEMVAVAGRTSQQ